MLPKVLMVKEKLFKIFLGVLKRNHQVLPDRAAKRKIGGYSESSDSESGQEKENLGLDSESGYLYEFKGYIYACPDRVSWALDSLDRVDESTTKAIEMSIRAAKPVGNETISVAYRGKRAPDTTGEPVIKLNEYNINRNGGNRLFSREFIGRVYGEKVVVKIFGQK